MRTRLLHSFGKRDINEYEWTMGPLAEDAIRVKTIMTGVCRSDIGAYGGMEQPMPFGRFGHEGLGQVVEVGAQIRGLVSEGQIVSTFSDPAYADYYFAKEGEFVVVEEADPKYILQPVACAVNIWENAVKMIQKLDLGKSREPVLVLGTGFLSMIIGMLPKADIHVVGKANAEYWIDRHIKRFPTTEDVDRHYSTVIDLSSKAENFDKSVNFVKDNGLLVYAATPTEEVKTNFFNACWKALTITLPSPRSKDFYRAMERSADLIKWGDLDVSWMWTKGYDRNTEFKQAFEDGLNRPEGYVRGYIKW